MFCQNCGAQLPEEALFCPNCGTRVGGQPAAEPKIVEEAAANVVTDVAVPEAVTAVAAAAATGVTEVAAESRPVYIQPLPGSREELSGSREDRPGTTVILVMGILAVCLAYFGVGFIFGAIGLSKANGYIKQFGSISGKGKVGRILSKVGLICGIIMAVLWTVLIGALIIEAVN